MVSYVQLRTWRTFQFPGYSNMIGLSYWVETTTRQQNNLLTGVNPAENLAVGLVADAKFHRNFFECPVRPPHRDIGLLSGAVNTDKAIRHSGNILKFVHDDGRGGGH